MPTELSEGTIEHFRNCLHEGKTKAILSYECELNIDALTYMDGVDILDVYLEMMTKSSSHTIDAEERGFWGDIKCIHWLQNWLKNPIIIFSNTMMKNYLHFNLDLCE